jgi:hypothetical protein
MKTRKQTRQIHIKEAVVAESKCACQDSSPWLSFIVNFETKSTKLSLFLSHISLSKPYITPTPICSPYIIKTLLNFFKKTEIFAGILKNEGAKYFKNKILVFF